MSMSPATGINAELLTEKPRMKEIPLAYAAEDKYYVCTVPAASFIRGDGKKIPFVRGYCITNIQGDIDYLEKEIVNGNQHLRHATSQEVSVIKMQLNPRETIREEVLNQELPGMVNSIRDKLLAELEAAGIDVSSVKNKPAQPVVSTPDASKIAGANGAPSGVLAALIAKRTGAAVVTTPTPAGAPLGGIQNTNNIKPAAAG